MNHFTEADNMVAVLAISAHMCYDSAVPQPHTKTGDSGVGSTEAALTSVLAKGETMAKPYSSGKRSDSATPASYEQYQSLKPLARHVSRETIYRLIRGLSDDAPVPPRANVIRGDFTPDDDGGKGAA